MFQAVLKSVEVLLLNMCNKLELSESSAFCLSGETFSVLGRQKKLLGCGLLGGISTQADTMSKILQARKCRSIISLSKIAHQMWHDHPFSQRNKATKKQWQRRLEARGGGGQYLKKEGREQYRRLFIK